MRKEGRRKRKEERGKVGQTFLAVHPTGKNACPTPLPPFPLSRFPTSFIRGLVPLAGLYLLIAMFFAPVVFEGQGLSPAADMVAAAGMFRMGEEAIASGRFPLWNPTLFSGLPMFASLQYALFVYPPEYVIRFLSHIFGGGNYRIWLFHYLLAGWFAYLLARHFGCGRLAAWLAGAAYGFSPQLIVLADVGHGSKLMAMTYLPLIWLMLDRLRLRPSVGSAAGLGAVFAVQILALHPQVAAYGAMLMGIYLVYWGVVSFPPLLRRGGINGGAPEIAGPQPSPTPPFNRRGGKEAPPPYTPFNRRGGKETSPPYPPFNRSEGGSPLNLWLRLIGWFAGAMALSLALSAVLWMSVLDYARFSTRGGDAGSATGGGVSWDYATGWSFHPLESVTYFIPNFMGFGNETYWGTVGTPDGTPFTHNPMYFGIVVLLLAIVAIGLTPKSRWGFPLLLGLFAWALSWGRYFPLLYGPFYHILPLFNKFRAPVMGQVLLLLPMAMMAGIGLEALLERLKKGGRGLFAKILWWMAGIAAAKALLILAAPGLFNGFYATFADVVRPGTHPQLLEAAADLARPDAARVLGITALLAGLAALAFGRQAPLMLLTVATVALFLLDLWPVNRKLVTFTPASSVQALFQPEGVVKRMQRDQDKFRIAPLDNRYRAANWWSYFGIESVGGYFGAKPAAYQKLMTAAGIETWDAAFRCPKVLDALNVRYVVTTYPLDRLFEELEKQRRGAPARPADLWHLEVMPRELRPGAGPFVYLNPGELPRARLVGEYRVIADVEGTIREMVSGRAWDPTREALLDREPEIQPEPGGGGTARITDYQPEKVTIETSLPRPKVLVLADEYYPSGWRATVDGRPAEILRADGVLRGVALPAGEHRVEFTFRPKLFYAGLWTSLLSLLLVMGIGAAAIVRSRRGD